jgi:hypothetical protein
MVKKHPRNAFEVIFYNKCKKKKMQNKNYFKTISIAENIFYTYEPTLLNTKKKKMLLYQNPSPSNEQ